MTNIKATNNILERKSIPKAENITQTAILKKRRKKQTGLTLHDERKEIARIEWRKVLILFYGLICDD